MASFTPSAYRGRRRGSRDPDASAPGARHRSDRPGWARRSRPARRRGRAGPRPHASLRGGGDAAGERRSRHRRPHRARIARRGTARCQCRLPRLDRPAGDRPGSCRARTARGVVVLSSPHQTPHLFFRQPNPMAMLDADIERLSAAAGLESTIIRPGMFASNALFWWATRLAPAGVRRPYGAAETAPVDDRDVAAVAARTLYQDGHAGGDYVLTGPESLSQAEQVSIIGDVLGRRITLSTTSARRHGPARTGCQPDEHACLADTVSGTRADSALRIDHRVNDEDVQAQFLSPSGIAVEPSDPDQKLGRGCVDDLDRELVGEAEVLVADCAAKQHGSRRGRRRCRPVMVRLSC